MNILLIGSGGREHALAWALVGKPALRPRCSSRRAIPAPRTVRRECRARRRRPRRASSPSARTRAIGLVVVGPEAPLVAGLADDLARGRHQGLRAEPGGGAARGLEGLHQGPLRRVRHPDRRLPPLHGCRGREGLSSPSAARRSSSRPTGLPRARASSSPQTVEEAEAAVDMMLGGGLGEAGAEVVIEEFLEGEEASFFALCDGTTAIPLGTAQDHKRAFDGDEGPNTGGMGAYSPAPVLTADARGPGDARDRRADACRRCAARGTPFAGVLYAGLMITAEGPKLIEYNVRFGDPEAQVLMPRLKSDLAAALLAACDGVLKTFDLRWSRRGGADRRDGGEGLSGRRSRRGSEIQRRRGGRGTAEDVIGLPCRDAAGRRPAPRRMAAACSTSPRLARSVGEAQATRLRGGRQDRLARAASAGATSAGGRSSASARRGVTWAHERRPLSRFRVRTGSTRRPAASSPARRARARRSCSLHGFPQTHAHVAPARAGARRDATASCAWTCAAMAGPRCRGATRRTRPIRSAPWDGTSVAVMEALGHARFALAGHDRGARVGYRLALDHPGRLERLVAPRHPADLPCLGADARRRGAGRPLGLPLGALPEARDRRSAAIPLPYFEGLMREMVRRRNARALRSRARLQPTGRAATSRPASTPSARITAPARRATSSRTRPISRRGARIRCPTQVVWSDFYLVRGTSGEGSSPLDVWRRSFAPDTAGRGVVSRPFRRRGEPERDPCRPALVPRPHERRGRPAGGLFGHEGGARDARLRPRAA